MLSVLIPIYNADVSNLVTQLHTQLVQSGIVFEIICIDDASTLSYEENISLKNTKEVKYIKLEKNIGRAAIRNMLAETANYDLLLFIDSDMQVVNNNYIQNYLYQVSDNDVVYGGLIYTDTLSNNAYTLRWDYGRKKEAVSAELRAKDLYLSVKTCNAIISKKLFLKIKFNENIQQYGHEDTLFCIELERQSAKVLHINNPLLHAGLEDAQSYLNKVQTACKSLYFIAHSFLNKEERTKIRLIYFYEKLDKMGLMGILNFFYKSFEGRIQKNLYSKKPSLLLLDYYKLISYYRIAKN